MRNLYIIIQILTIVLLAVQHSSLAFRVNVNQRIVSKSSTSTVSSFQSASSYNNRRIFPLQISNNPEIENSKKSLFRLENLPFVVVVVSVMAFTFQYTTLYPWHIALHDYFEALEVGR